MTNIQILSDLHLESPKGYDIFEIVPTAPILALLGDIGNIIPHKTECLSFLTRQLQQFQVVFLVPGNHEAYGSTWDETLSVLKEFQQGVESKHDLGKFVLLDRGVHELPANGSDRLIILGCSLFSHIPAQSEMAVEMGLQDFFQSTSWNVQAHNEAHDRDLAWLNDQVSQLEQCDHNTRVIIFTHWSPTKDPRSCDPRHLESPITSGFATDLSNQPCFTSGQVVLWAFGHTHYNCDFFAERKDVKAMRLVTNQRGYYFAQAKGFDKEKLITLA